MKNGKVKVKIKKAAAVLVSKNYCECHYPRVAAGELAGVLLMCEDCLKIISRDRIAFGTDGRVVA